jgi:Ca2+/Na+ antiporter
MMVGASFMAFGSAAPEIIVNAIATIKADGTSDLGVGAIIGYCPLPRYGLLFCSQYVF